MNSSDLRIQLIEVFQFEVLLLRKQLSTVILSLRGTKVRKLSVPAKFFPVNIGLLWGFAPLFPLYVFFRGMPEGGGRAWRLEVFYGRLAPCSLMLLFFASPKKSNQKKGESCADGGPQRTACGCWLWREAATHPARLAYPRRSACLA